MSYIPISVPDLSADQLEGTPLVRIYYNFGVCVCVCVDQIKVSVYRYIEMISTVVFEVLVYECIRFD